MKDGKQCESKMDKTLKPLFFHLRKFKRIKSFAKDRKRSFDFPFKKN